MLRSYFKIGWRNLLKNRIYSFINIGGLALGMGVAILIALWVNDEISFDRHHENFDRIAQVMQHQTYNEQIGTQEANPGVLAAEIRNLYAEDFVYVVQASWNFPTTLTSGDKILMQPGSFFEPGIAEMLSLEMIYGDRNGLEEMNSILLSESVAKTYFGEENPLGKILRLNDEADVKVTGVYRDLPYNSSFRDMKFITTWALWLSMNKWARDMTNPWGSNFSRTYVMIADHADLDAMSRKIKDVKLNKVSDEEKRYNPVIFLHPMSKWHLFSEFKNGLNTGGRIANVWLFGIIGGFVLILACINFMNLSTARSEKRAREVGIRKAVGSLRKQLVAQFFSESILISLFAFLCCILLIWLVLPYFNTVADKQIRFPWSSPGFWTFAAAFTVLTGLLAGLYPALFLSSFDPVRTLKGTFRVGRYASVPRKVLVVLQFTISTTLIIGTMVVYLQIDHARNRPLGYDKDGLISLPVTQEVHNHFEALRTELVNAGVIVEMAESASPTTSVWNTNGGFDWEGKDPDLAVDFPNNAVSHDYGKTIGWELSAGRDFSREFASDTAAFVLNESAVQFIGLEDPVGKVIRWEGTPFTVIGIVKDLLVQSPYAPVRPSMFHLSLNQQNLVLLKLNPSKNPSDAIAIIEASFKKLSPAFPFSASFVDEEYAAKFGNEKRMGELAFAFAFLAIVISCLGLFGLASFVAEQRTKEVGIRKVMGASVSNLWSLLSKDFVMLVMISSILSVPIAWFLINDWLGNYEYRTDIPWWIFAVSISGVVVITLLTVSYQVVRASLMNPVKSLRTE